jgi:hypothetical protein
MKAAIVLMTLILLLPASSFGGGLKQLQSTLSDGTSYIYEVQSDSRDHWDPIMDDNPPLTPGDAAYAAQIYMQEIPLPENARGWELRAITLEQISYEPDHWVYVIRFLGEADPETVGGSVMPWFAILVRLDGTIPSPLVQTAMR